MASTGESLRTLAEEGVALLNAISRREPEALRPWLLDSCNCKAVVMLWGTKIGTFICRYVVHCRTILKFASLLRAGLGLGVRSCHGVVFAKLPPGPGPHDPAHPAPTRWSAPLFVRVRVGQVGLCFGWARTRNFLLSMNTELLRELDEGKG